MYQTQNLSQWYMRICVTVFNCGHFFFFVHTVFRWLQFFVWTTTAYICNKIKLYILPSLWCPLDICYRTEQDQWDGSWSDKRGDIEHDSVWRDWWGDWCRVGGGVTGELHLLQSAHGLHHQVEPGENRLCGNLGELDLYSIIIMFFMQPQGQVAFNDDGSRVHIHVEVDQYRLNEDRTSIAYILPVNESLAQLVYTRTMKATRLYILVSQHAYVYFRSSMQ